MCVACGGRYLWFYCAHPPNPEKTLGLWDAEADTLRHYPDASAKGAYVDPRTGDAYFTAGTAIWRRPPDPEAGSVFVNRMPGELIGARPFRRLATHLTLSADRRRFFVDSQFGLQWRMGTLPLDGGPYEDWARLGRNYNHAQFSPTNPDLALFSQEYHFEPVTGVRLDITNRMWLLRRGEEPRPIFQEPVRCTHEFWDPDGGHVWFIWHPDADNHGTYRVNLRSGETEKIWPAHCAWHSHLHPSGKYLVGDRNPFGFHRGARSLVEFFNIETGKTFRIADNPELDDPLPKTYHIDPHPRFCADGNLVVFTTTVRGRVELAAAATEDLIAATS